MFRSGPPLRLGQRSTDKPQVRQHYAAVVVGLCCLMTDRFEGVEVHLQLHFDRLKKDCLIDALRYRNPTKNVSSVQLGGHN